MGLGTTTKTGTDTARFVRRAFGDESSVQITDADLINWLNDGIRTIAQKLKINRRRGFADIVQDNPTYAFNDLEIIEIESLMVDKVLVTSLEYQEAENELFINDPYREDKGRPQFWYTYADNVELWPTPDFSSTQGLMILYIASPGQVAALTDTLTIPDKHLTALNHYVLAQAYQLDEDWEAYTLKMQEFTAMLEGQIDEDKVSATRFYPSITITQEF